MVAMAIAAVGYFSLWVVDDPIGKQMYIAAALVGLGEIFANLSATSLIGQEAPVDIRGSILGLFNLCGSVGILCITVVAGYIFDAWMPGGAFIFVGIVNLAVFVAAFLVRQKVGYRNPHAEHGSGKGD